MFWKITGEMEIEMKKAILFFDIDGTLLSEVTGKIPESALEALDRAKKCGHQMFINTGRTVCSIPPEIRRFSFDGYLCGCGTCIVYKDEELFSSSIDTARGKEIINKMFECGLTGLAEGPYDVYFPERATGFDNLERTRRYFRGRGMGIEQYIESGNFVYDKLFIYAGEKSDKDGFFEFIKDDMDVVDRGQDTYEVIQKGFTKATACSYIMEKLGYVLDQAYVFGDSSNDLDMFRFAKHSVAMGKHADVLEPYTEFVTTAVEDEGIRNALMHYGLI